MKNNLEELIRRLFLLLDEIGDISREVSPFMAQTNWPEVIERLRKRGELLEELLSIRDKLNHPESEALSLREKKQLNDRIYTKLENITKVNSKLFDIITMEREKISDAVKQANQGLDFLKNYRKQVNHQENVCHLI
ncbi:MAG: hypothetical protein Kow0042_31080 [Calditrichia bacterium]